MAGRSGIQAGRRARQQAVRLAGELRLARATLGLSLRRVAARAAVAPSTGSRAEAGDPNLTLRHLCALADAVGLDLVVRAFPGRTLGLRDTGQLALAQAIRAQASAAWRTTLELGIGEHGQSIDMVLFGPEEIWAIEIERMATDFQAQYRRGDAKRRVLADAHRRPVRLVIALEDGARNRSAVAPHAALIGSALPARPRQVLAALRNGQALGTDGLVWLRRPSRHHPSTSDSATGTSGVHRPGV